MLRRHQLWNALVEVERAYRAQAQLALSGRSGRSRLTEEQKQTLEELEIARRVAVKRAQADSGLYWCNYDDVINSYQRARKQIGAAGELRRRRWDGSGKVTVRFQSGLPVSDVFGGDTRLQLEAVPPAAFNDPCRGIRRRLRRSKVRIRIGTDRRQPVWLELPMVLHRELPVGSLVRAASVTRETIGQRYRWRLLLTVEQQDAAAPRSGPAVAIDLGWRMVGGELRVAYWEDEAGEHGDLALNRDLLWAFAKLNELRSKQDLGLNAMRERLQRWSRSAEAPEWMQLQRIESWRARRFLRLHAAWEGQRFSGDEGAFAALSEWRTEHLRLQAWEENLRDQTARRRRQLYREFAARLTASHGPVFIEDFDLREFARRPAGDDARNVYAAPMRVIACPSVLRRCLEEKGGCERIAAHFSTQQCSWCGRADHWDAARQLSHTCPGCGERFDQDRNAARNILWRGLGAVTAARASMYAPARCGS
jgi:hypothetical protein